MGNTSEALKPCPFCGSTAALTGNDEVGWFVLCMDPSGEREGSVCYATVGQGYDRDGEESHMFYTSEAAIAAWNRRAGAEGSAS